MLRATFFSMGLFVFLWGGAFLLVDRVILNSKEEPQRQAGFRGLFTTVNAERRKEFNPPEWAAFSLLSIGSVTMLYSVALPKKKKEG